MDHSAKKLIVPNGLGFLPFLCQAAVTTVEEGGAGYSETGAWTPQSVGFASGGGWKYQNVAAGSDTATFEFTGLPSGKYVVSTPSYTQANVSGDADWTLSDGLGVRNVVQNGGTTHFDNDAGVTFQRLNSSVGSSVSLLSITDGTFSGVLTDNDAGRFLISDALRLESVRMDVMNIHIIDNGGPGYAETGGAWTDFAGDLGDYGTGLRFSSDLNAQATVSFSGLDAGMYRVSTAWTTGNNRPSSVSLGYATTGATDSMLYSQLPGSAADDVFEEANWQDMFTDVPVTDGTLTLTLENESGGFLIADGFRLEMTGNIPEPSSVALVALSGLALLRRRRK